MNKLLYKHDIDGLLGWQLIAAYDIPKGSTIVEEAPLVFVDSVHTSITSDTWRLVEQLLANPAVLQTYYSWKLKVTNFPPDKSDLLTESVLVRRYKRPRQMVRNLYCGVATNNIGYWGLDGKIAGHALYEVLSRANHSCAPNAIFSIDTAGTRVKQLTAERDIICGESITWNYAGPLLLQASYDERNMVLAQYYRFACGCERCQAEMPVHLHGHKDKLKYFLDRCQQTSS